MNIGFVGLGAMGRALAVHLAKSGNLLVWDLNPSAIAALEAEGAEAARSLADLGSRCDIVVLCLPKSSNVSEALFGEGGLAEVMRPGSVVVDQTSGLPSETRSFAAKLAERNIELIDAPVAGGVPSAIAGQITVMASGSQAAFDKVHDRLAVMTPNLFRCSSRVGDGQALKAINNITNAACRMMTLEVLALARRLGLTADEVTKELNAGEGCSFVTLRLLPAVVENRSSTDFSLGLMVKDLNQAAMIGAETGSPMPISDTARGMIHFAYNLLGSDSRLDDVVQFMEQITATRFVGEREPVPAEISMATDAAMALVTDAIAICNRLIILENAAVALRIGLDVANFAPVMLSGSAYSRQAERLFDGLLGRGRDSGRSVGEMLDCLTRLTRAGAELGVPMMMANQARAVCLASAATLGATATLAQFNASSLNLVEARS